MTNLLRHKTIATVVTVTAIPASATSVQLTPADSERKGLQIFNNSTSSLYCTWGAPAFVSGASFVLLASGLYESPLNFNTVGISGKWDVANGSGIVTSFS